MIMKNYKNIYLTGFMGSGKSTIGPILANALGWEFYDLDKVIEERESKKIKDLFTEKGEKYFRSIETEILDELSLGKNFIIALGGGTMANPDNLDILKKNGKVIYLKVSTKAAYSRLKYKRDRPMLTGDGSVELSEEQFTNRINELLRAREKFYSQADYVIDTDRIPVGITVDKLVKLIHNII